MGTVSRPTRLLPGAGLALLGIALVLISTGFKAKSTLRGPSADVAASAGSLNPLNINANNSPTLAQDPRNPSVLALANRIDTPLYSCALSVSHDGGAIWTSVPVPLAAGQHKCYAPDVAFGADGTLYMSYVTLVGRGNTPDGAWLVRSTDAGRTISAPVHVRTGLVFQVRIATDPARPQRLYMSWLQASTTGSYSLPIPGNPIEVARSDDGGVQWTTPVRVSDPALPRVLAPVPVAERDGRVYVLYLNLGDDQLDYEGADGGVGGPPYSGHWGLVLARSTDAGATWDQSVITSAIVPTRRFLVFLPPYPALAIDPHSGRIYVAFEDALLGDPDVYMWTLAPGAHAWSGPTRVNDTPPHDHTWQYLAALAVAPDGRLDVAYYDRRQDPSNRLTGVSLQSSFDGGRTFTPHVPLSNRLFNSQIGFGEEREMPELGSRLALVSDDSYAVAAWADTRYGSLATNKQVIESASASFTTQSGLSAPVRDLLRYGGIALLLAALAAIGAAASKPTSTGSRRV